MAYSLGVILQRSFDIAAISVKMGTESLSQRNFHYDIIFPEVSLAEMENQINADDILIVNPSFSGYSFGLRLPGLKISYVQHFNTYPVLDTRFDHYVAVGDFVANFLRHTYGIRAPVIHPYIGNIPDCNVIPWAERPALVVLPYRKGTYPEIWDLSFRRLRELLGQSGSNIEFAEPIGREWRSQAELAQEIGRYRYLLTLSAAEGFGLVPLESMATGTIPVGYDGYGGREYMRPGTNCCAVEYAKIERLAEKFLELVSKPARGAKMSKAARRTAVKFTYAAFEAAWIKEFSRILGQSPRVAPPPARRLSRLARWRRSAAPSHLR
jgi:hypothetical protein